MRDHLNKPKFVLNAANDQFFMPDSGGFYLPYMFGENHVRYVPNSGHFINCSAINSVIIFFDNVTKNKPMPRLRWKSDGDWKLSLTVEGSPDKVVLWKLSMKMAGTFVLQK